MHHLTELPFVNEFCYVSPLQCLKNGWCMLQAEPPSLHYYCAVVLHPCIILPPVSHSSNHEYYCCQLTRQSSCVSNFIALLRFSFDSLPCKYIITVSFQQHFTISFIVIVGLSAGQANDDWITKQRNAPF